MFWLKKKNLWVKILIRLHGCASWSGLSRYADWFDFISFGMTQLKLSFTTTYHSLGRFSTRHFGIFFLFLLENWIWHFMQIACSRDNLYEVSYSIFEIFFLENWICHLMHIYLLRRQFVWSVISNFPRKIFQNVVFWNFYPACKVLTTASSRKHAYMYIILTP